MTIKEITLLSKEELKQWLETKGLNLIVGEGDIADDC